MAFFGWKFSCLHCLNDVKWASWFRHWPRLKPKRTWNVRVHLTTKKKKLNIFPESERNIEFRYFIHIEGRKEDVTPSNLPPNSLPLDATSTFEPVCMITSTITSIMSCTELELEHQIANTYIATRKQNKKRDNNVKSGYRQTAEAGEGEKQKKKKYSQITIHFQRRPSAGGNEWMYCVLHISFNLFDCKMPHSHTNTEQKINWNWKKQQQPPSMSVHVKIFTALCTTPHTNCGHNGDGGRSSVDAATRWLKVGVYREAARA